MYHDSLGKCFGVFGVAGMAAEEMEVLLVVVGFNVY